MLQSVLPFVRRKSGEFWAWQLLAEVEQDDETLYLACLLRSVNCKTQDTFLVKILYLLTNLSLAKRDYQAARSFLTRYVAVKTSKQSRMPSEVYHWINETWYHHREEQLSSKILQMEYKQITDEFLFADVPERVLYITHIVDETRIAKVVYGYQRKGHVKLPKSIKPIYAGTCLLARFKVSDPPNETLKPYTMRKVRWEDMPPTNFLRTVDGMITTNRGKTAFFVKYEKEFAFLPKDLYKDKSIDVGTNVTARIVYDFQKSKACWSWRCISFK